MSVFYSCDFVVLDHRKQDTVYIGLHLPRQQREHRRHRHHRHKKSKDDNGRGLKDDPMGRYQLLKFPYYFLKSNVSSMGQLEL